MTRKIQGLAVVGLLVACAAVTVGAKMKVKTQHDKQFAFAGLHTYAWHPTGAGEFKMLQATGEDPAALRARFEPVIKRAVEQVMAARGFTLVPAEQADLHVYYYVLIGPGSSSQEMGQFVGGITEWGLPPFTGATTSFNAFEQGSLLIDFSSPKLTSMVWRGVAQAEIDRKRSPAERDQRLDDAVRQVLKSFPPKK